MRFSSPRSCWTAVLLLLAVGAFRAFAGPGESERRELRGTSSQQAAMAVKNVVGVVALL
jgi:hypothetical protein